MLNQESSGGGCVARKRVAAEPKNYEIALDGTDEGLAGAARPLWPTRGALRLKIKGGNSVAFVFLPAA